MTPDLQSSLSRKYVCGAFILALDSGRFACFPHHRRGDPVIYETLPEALDFIREASIIPEPAPARRASRSNPRFTLEDLGL